MQALMVAAVAIVISSTLLLLWFLDNPYHSGVGGLKPVAMERSLALIDRVAPVVGGLGTLPCDALGAPTS